MKLSYGGVGTGVFILALVWFGLCQSFALQASDAAHLPNVMVLALMSFWVLAGLIGSFLILWAAVWLFIEHSKEQRSRRQKHALSRARG